jgi:hypothetical protein
VGLLNVFSSSATVKSSTCDFSKIDRHCCVLQMFVWIRVQILEMLIGLAGGHDAMPESEQYNHSNNDQASHEALLCAPAKPLRKWQKR